jgi:hypothetical protein
MAYYADGSGTLKELPQKNVETDIFVPIIQIIEQST